MARIYQTSTMGETQLRVAIVDAMGEADLWVKRVDSWGLAVGDARWFVTASRQDATCRVFFCSQGMAQLKVAFVDAYGQAGWRVEHHPFKGRL